ncbi:MAG TPA: hypothetical protein VMT47_10035 [Polyangia bacterium]|nr:hypothetical protein [Polyangia bacterium]
MALLTRGAISEVLMGHHVDQDVRPDGKFLRDASVENCLIVETGQFVKSGNISFKECHFDFQGSALNVFELAQMLLNPAKPAE